MDTHRIKIFHRADRDDVSIAVAHDLKFDLFPAGDTFLHQNLRDRGKTEPCGSNLAQLCFVNSDAAAGAAEGKGGAHDNRIACRVREGESTLKRRRNDRGNDRLPDRFHGAFKNLTVFGFGNGFRVCAKKCNALLCQKAFLCQLHRKRQAGLTAEGGKNAVRVFFFDDFF